MKKRKNHALVVGSGRTDGTAVRFFLKIGLTVSVILPRAKKQRWRAGTAQFTADFSNESDVRATLDRIVKKNGPINRIVFFHPLHQLGSSWEHGVQAWLGDIKNIIEMLAFGLGLHNCAIVIVSGHRGALVSPADGNIGQYVARASLSQVVRYYAVSLGPRGIRLNLLTHQTLEKDAGKPAGRSKRRGVLARVTPLSRVVSSDDVINALDFLCDERSAFITGQEIVVDGGLSLQYQEEMAYGLRQDINGGR